MARSRDSITLIPPNSTNGLSLAISIPPTLMIFCVISLCLLSFLRQRCSDKATEQRMTITRSRGELRVELASDEPWMIRCFHHFNQRTVTGATGDLEAGFNQLRQQVVVHFIAMTMALNDYILAVAGMYLRAGLQLAVLRAQAHGTAQVGSISTLLGHAGGVLPFGDQTDYRMSADSIEFGGIGISPAQHIAGELDNRDLHAEADTQVGNLVLTGVLHGLDLAFHAAQTEAARHQNGINAFKQRGAFVLDVFGVDITQIDLGTVLDARMAHRFDQRFVG